MAHKKRTRKITQDNHPTTILVADDDPDLRDILHSLLEPEGFRVLDAPDGKTALEKIREEECHLLILDYMMPGLTGPEVCRHIKKDMLLRHLPVIMLTGKSESQDKVYAIKIGADDYVVKPFEPQELLARVQMVLRRTTRDLEANPLTRLPGNIAIQQEFEIRLATHDPIAVGYVDLDRFKAFNDHYGFRRGDTVIKRTAEILLSAVKMHGNDLDFVGHIGGDDFVVVTTPQKADAVCKTIVETFDAMVQTLYDKRERTQGFFLHTDRKGKAIKIPLLSISIALVTNEKHNLSHPGQIAELGAELKAYAKQFDRSIYVKQRRKVQEKS